MSKIMYSCRRHYEPTPLDFGGCLPCPRVPPVPGGEPWTLLRELRVAAASSECVHCLLLSRQPFLVGRPGMGAPEEVGCALATGHAENDYHNRTSFWSEMRRTLKTLNGVLTKGPADTLEYARCYFASINASDIIVRLGGGSYMPLRKPLTLCARPGSKHHQKADIMCVVPPSTPLSLEPSAALALCEGHHERERTRTDPFLSTASQGRTVGPLPPSSAAGRGPQPMDDCRLSIQKT